MKNNDIQLEAVPAHKLGDIKLAQRAVHKLTDAYPGYHWRVGINDEQLGGIMYIMNLDINEAVFSNSPYGYVLHLLTVYQDPNLNCVLKAGGEILERAYLARGKNKGDPVKKVDGIPDLQQPRNKLEIN